MRYVKIKSIKKIKDFNEPVYNLHVKDNHNYFANGIVASNCHLSSAKVLKYICSNSINAHQRIGLTGTLKVDKIHPLQVQANFGGIKRVVSTKELQDSGRASDTQITAIQLSYDELTRKEASYMCYEEEIKFLIGNKKRNKVITTLANKLKGNSLFLFGRIDDHLIKIYELLKESNKDVHMIHGGIKGKEREEIKRKVSSGDDIILLASYKTMSTGVSIKKLHNLVLCHPVKSVISVLQSIGRMLRLHETKSIAQIYDIFDDMKYGKKANITLRHFIEYRRLYYKDEKHKVKLKKVELKG